MKDFNAFSLAGRKKRRTAILKNKITAHPLPASVSSIGILFPTLPLPGMQASVIVPAKDESLHITNTLDALRNQQQPNGQQMPYDAYEVLLLTNNCSDDTYALAVEYQQQHPQFQLHIADIHLSKPDAHIGTARRLLMDEAFRRHTLNKTDGLILSTDGDTEADVHWIASTLHEMSSDCEALGGRIIARNVEAANKKYYLLDTTYRCLSAKLDALMNGEENGAEASHFQCFGASLAVRCSAYHRAGRLPVIPCLEDEAFSRALHRVDARIKKSSAVKVYTSARLQGRVTMGLSVHLAHLGKMQKNNHTMHVESLGTLLEKYRIRQWLRTAWQQHKRGLSFSPLLTRTELASGVPRAWLMKEIHRSVYFGECWEKLETAMYMGKWKQQQQPVPVTEAISELRQHLKEKYKANG